jgi:hypothetical protein
MAISKPVAASQVRTDDEFTQQSFFNTKGISSENW